MVCRLTEGDTAGFGLDMVFAHQRLDAVSHGKGGTVPHHLRFAATT